MGNTQEYVQCCKRQHDACLHLLICTNSMWGGQYHTPVGTVKSQIQYSWNETQWEMIPQVVEHSEISLVKLLLTIFIIYNSLESIYCCHMHWERASWANSKFKSSAHEWITAGSQTLLFILVTHSVVMIFNECKSAQPHWKKLFCLLFTFHAPNVGLSNVKKSCDINFSWRSSDWCISSHDAKIFPNSWILNCFILLLNFF